MAPGSDHTPTDPVLSDVHRQYLNDHAISDEVIESQGIRSEGDRIVFTWRHGDQVTEQRRTWPVPEEGLPLGADGKPIKYAWEPGKTTHFNVAREPGAQSPVLLCEGTKQHLAVASWAPPEYAVYGMVGCWGWAKENLARFKDRHVLILLDGDAAIKHHVYEAGEKLAEKLRVLGALAFFIWSPADGDSGIDDFLGDLTGDDVDDQCRDVLQRLIAAATAGKGVIKPAASKPRQQPSSQVDTGGRGDPVYVNADRRAVIWQILTTIRDRWNATELFCYGGALTRLRNAKTEPLSRDAFLRWLAEGVACFRQTMLGVESCWPDNQTVGAVLSSADDFAPLSRIVRMPFIRADGTVCAKNGYDYDPDTGTGTFLALGNSGMDRLDIPDAPSREEGAAAARWLLDEWLGDMPFRDDASQANALGLVITPFIRGLVPLVPLAVISGLQIGVGKNLFADCLSVMMTGVSASPLQWIPDDDDEVRKQLLSAFRQGDSLICFDEAHAIGGAALSRALTALTYTDRILGVSQMASFPNQATWLALGNQVQVNADMSRRTFWIELYPAGPNPQDRDESSFTHPDLRGWTTANRPEIVTAILTMIRAWFAAGQPPCSRGSLMGSFESWDKKISGILDHARVTGFLDNMAERRAQADFTGGYWNEHLTWLHDVFGDREFTVLQVKDAASASSGLWTPPPGLDDLQDRSFARKLGQAYARNRERWFGPYRLLQIGRGHNNVVKWRIGELSDDTPADLGGGQQGGNDDGDQEFPEDFGETLADLQKDGTGGNESGKPPVDLLPDLGKDSPGGNGGNISSPPAHAYVIAHDTHAHTRSRASHAMGPFVTPHPPVTPRPPIAWNGLDIAADLETGAADDLFTYTQRDETGYVRLAGIIGPAGVPAIVSGRDVLPLLDMATEITGHNFLGFDLLALAWHCGADYDALAPKVRDTELIARQADPPRSRESGSSEDRYGLDAVAERLKLPGKTDSAARLKRKFGGYDMIPLDDPEFRSYLEGDLRATAAVAQRLQHDDYTRREHTLAALAGRMTLNGFRVDQPLLAERLAQGQARKREALQLLADGWGLPLTKTITRGRGADKREETEPVDSPLGTDAGRAWLEQMYEQYQVPDPPRTQKTGKLAIGADQLKAVTADPVCPGELRSMIALMNVVTTTRTVYQTASDCLAPDGRVHPMVSMRQASGRWSVTNPGLTVFGKRGGRHVERDIFLPDEGHVLLSFDLSQVDMRGMAWLSQDHAYRALFARGKDAHTEIGNQVGLDRQSAKMVGHGWNYGLGAPRMKREGMDPGMVDAFIRGMEERFPVLIAWRETIRAIGAAGEILDNGFRRRMRCDPARAYTVAPALMGQGSARDIMCQSLLRLPRETWPMLRVMVHDEIVLSVPAGDARDVAETVMAAMTWQLDDDLPVLCDMAAGRNWGECSAH